MTGPLASGKTTFLKYISKDKIPDGPSGALRSFKVEDAIFNEVTDFSGADAWLKDFDVKIEKHDYILFFFDVSKYIKDEKYRINVNSRVDFIYKKSTSKQVKLMVGTHIDEAVGNYRSIVENLFAGKPYQSMLNKMVYIDTTKKECVKTILNELEK